MAKRQSSIALTRSQSRPVEWGYKKASAENQTANLEEGVIHPMERRYLSFGDRSRNGTVPNFYAIRSRVRILVYY